MAQLTRLVWLTGVLLSLVAVILLGGNEARAGQLNYGKYFGTIKMDGQAEALAVSLDAFVTQINDPTSYPALNIIVRANLGGYSSSEYVGYHFYNPTFNFEKGILQLNDPQSDLTATLQVTNADSETILEGPVTHRLTNAKGTMRVSLKLFGAPPVMPGDSLLSVLKGEYVGSCGQDPAELQIETGRGLGEAIPGNALVGYSITGRMGYTNGRLCYPDKTNKYCSLYPYSAGSYSPFTNHLTMRGPLGTIDCTKSHDTLNCVVAGFDKHGACVLTKKSAAASAPAVFPASIALSVPPELKMPLPAPLPPGNEELVGALQGEYYGFLHFENRDVYQLMEMGVVATTSTENPHVQNQVMVEPTILLRLGASWNSTPILSLAYPQRVFWLSTGFAFQSPEGDYFAVIGEWGRGYVSGVFYSRTFGRVGTFEMQKGNPPEIPANMALLPDPTGSYLGPKEAPKLQRDLWSLSLEIPNQSSGAHSVGVPMQASYRGPGQMAAFDEATFDLNTGALSFLMKRAAGDRLVTGEVIPGGNLKLLWPAGPVLGAPMHDYKDFTYVLNPKKQGE